jgi:NAD(P)-dependent dehydrogenase (short-subunit alcohol dehydrogenase family)
MSESGGQRPEQEQGHPGTTSQMTPQPRDEMRDWVGRGQLQGKRALITGGDSGIGRAVAIAFAKEGADVAIAYLSEHEDAEHTRRLVEQEGRRCVLLPGDLAEEAHCDAVVQRTVDELGGLDVLVNHVGTQEPVQDLSQLSTAQWDRTFKVNLYSHFWTTRAALPHLPDGASILFTGSVNGLRGNKSLIDYAATKGAIHMFAKSLAQSLQERQIRVNVVAPGPVWTPLIPATMPPEKSASFGQHAPMGRAAQPDEIAPSYVFLAADASSSYYTGQVLAPIGGETHPG